MKDYFILLTILMIVGPIKSQTQYDQNYFRSPVDHALFLSGTFGELRPNHFHAGIDIKAKSGKVGESIFAAADGYAYRVKVATGGYGRALYLRHDNGLITVYAHLAQYAKPLEDWIKEEQYQKESFEIERFPQVDQFRFKKGDYIGKMGMSGRSYGPHLHFEVRDEGEVPLNPLLFGFKVTDNRMPIINSIKIYNLNEKKETLDTKTYKTVKNKKGQYHIKKDTLYIDAWRTGIAIKTFDLMNGVKNWNGVYKTTMYIDDKPYYAYTMDKIPFDKTRYINAHMDYEEQQKNKSYFNRCFRLPGNDLTIYDPQLTDGILPLFKDKAQKVTFKVEDIKGNTSQLIFWVKRGEVKPAGRKNYNYLLPFNEESIIFQEEAYLSFPKGSFYENIYLNLEEITEDNASYYSPVLSIKSKQPIHRYSEIKLQPYTDIGANLDKYYIAQCTDKGEYTYCGHEIEGDMIKAKIRNFGDFVIKKDTIAPKISKVYFRKSMKGSSYMRFKAKDDVSDIKYRAEVDGHWILMSYDPKTNILEYRFDKNVDTGNHKLSLSVWDQNDNIAIFESSFIR